ncbi:MAG: Maf family protein [Candidatus Odinarchaeota archaeon]
MKRIFLASQSKRRSTLLLQLGLRFETILPQIQETVISTGSDTKIVEIVQSNALRKAQSLLNSVSEGLIISGDTLVVTEDNRILGKPQTHDEAIQMLLSLVDTWHRIISAVAVIDVITRNSLVRHLWTRIRFRKVSDEAIRQYVSTKEPFGKAGGYAIQGKGGFLVDRVEGSYTSVIGLPLELVIELLDEFGVKIWQYWST